MLKVIIDTNVLVSCLIPSKFQPIREALKFGKFILISSIPIFDELLKVIDRPKITAIIDQEAKLSLIELIRETALFVSPPKNPTTIITKDPSDDFFLLAAKAAKANLIVSKDKHLLNLKSFAGIPIILPGKFIQLINGDIPSDTPLL